MHTYEKCVLCGQTTNIAVDLPVEIRKNYIQGCGQLCDACHAELKRSMHTETSLLLDQEMQVLLEMLRNPSKEATG